MNALAGTRALLRLILRRDRFLMPIWIGLIPLTLLIQPSATRGLFPTPEQLEVYARTLATPALVALYGPVFGASLGAVSVTRAGLAAVILGLVAMLTVIRHTRTEEEAGRRELLGANAVGRHAPLTAALIATSGASVLVGVIVTAGMAGQDLPVAGSVAAGASYAGVGLMFAAAGAVAAQITHGAGGARGLGIMFLGVAFVLRLVGDVSTGPLSTLSWLSPIGWGQQMRPYADERWWVLLPIVLFLAVACVTAVALSARRDVGAGLVEPRPGPAVGSSRLRTPLALAWRLHRGALAGWAAGFVLLGLMLGGSARAIEGLVAESPELEEIFRRMGGEAALIDAYLAAIMGFFALIASGYGIQAVMKMRAEETSLRAEPVLAAPVARLRWLGSHLTFAALGPVAVLVAGGVAIGLVHGVASGDVARELPRVLAGAMVQLPAVWVLVGIAVAAFGILPRFAGPVAWGALGAFLLLGQIGPALRLDQWLMDLSPYTHIPTIPGGALEITPLAWLALAAAGLAVAGLAAFPRRDLASG